MDPRRAARVAESIRDELGEMLAFELEDPRIGSPAITEVQISPDGKKAQIRLQLEGDEAARRGALTAINGARGYLKSELGRRLTLFRIPDLQFEADVSAELAAKLPSLLKRIKKGRPRPDAPDEKKPLQ